MHKIYKFFPRRTCLTPRNDGQRKQRLLKLCQFMSPSFFVGRIVLGCCLAVASSGLLFGQASFTTNGGEYAISARLPGDQVHPHVSINSDGGFIVWEDNLTDGDGQGISAMALDTNLSRVQSSFRVNGTGVADQERPQVALLNEGGAVFVWQSGRRSAQHIYGRFLSPSNTWSTGDLLVNTFTNNSQINPVLVTLTNGIVVVAWSSFNQQSPNSLK